MKVVKQVEQQAAPAPEAAKKSNKKFNAILISIIAVLVVAFLFCGYKVVSILSEYKEAEKMYQGLSDKYASAPAVTPSPKPVEDGEEVEDDGLDPEVSPIEIDFDTLLADCEDIVGWLYSPDTVINYPVAQAEDNDKYLYNFIDGRYNGSGTLFFDYLCEPDLTSTNTVMYGHHMNDGSMLASLCNYDRQDYYEAHPVLYFNSPQQNYRIEVFSAYITDPGAVSYIIEFGEDYTFQNFLDEVRGLSEIQSPVEVTTEDRIITFSTCTYEYDNARFVVHGKLVPIH